MTSQSGIYGTVAIDSTHVKATAPWRAQRGDFPQAIGRSRGGRTTKLHGLTDAKGRPRVLLLTASNVNDITVAADLVRAIGPFHRLIADRYDADYLRNLIKSRKAEPVIPRPHRDAGPFCTTNESANSAIASNECGAGSRIGAASPHDTISS